MFIINYLLKTFKSEIINQSKKRDFKEVFALVEQDGIISRIGSK